MKICPVCQNGDMPDNTARCFCCGYDFSKDATSTSQTQSQPQPQPQTQSQPQQQEHQVTPAPEAYDTNYTQNVNQSKSSILPILLIVMIPIAILLVIAIIVGGVIISLLRQNNEPTVAQQPTTNSQASTVAEPEDETEDEPETAIDDDETELTGTEEPEEVVEDVENASAQDAVPQYDVETGLFLGGSNAVPITEVLFPQTWASYQSDYPNFSFSYPAEFYSEAYHDKNIVGNYGTILDKVTLVADGGYTTYFSICTNEMGGNTEAVLASVKASELNGKYITSDDYQWDKWKPEGSRFIATGTDSANENVFYNMVYIDDSYIYQMLIWYPHVIEGDEYDMHRKFYYTECLYRMCGFSGSSKPFRSFNEYVTEQQSNE